MRRLAIDPGGMHASPARHTPANFWVCCNLKQERHPGGTDLSHINNQPARKAVQGSSLLLAGIVLNCWVVLGMAVAQSGPLAGSLQGNSLFLGTTALSALATLPLTGRLKHAEGCRPLQGGALGAAELLAVLAATAFLAGFTTGNGDVALLGMALMGIFCGLAEILLFARFAEFGHGGVPAAVAFVTLVSAVATAPFDLLPVDWSYTLFALSPALMAPLLLGDTRPAPEGCGQTAPDPRALAGTHPEDSPSQDSGFAYKLMLANLLVTTTFNLLVSEALISLPWEGWLSCGRLLANILVCAVLLVALIRFDRFDVSALYRVVVPVTVLGLLILSAIPASLSPVAVVCVSMGYSIFDACTWIILLQTACARGRDLVKTACLYTATTFLGMTLANGMLMALGATQAVDLSQNTPSILLAVLVLAVSTMLVLPPRKHVEAQSPQSDAPGLSEAGAGAATQAALTSLAEGAALTNREREVLALLAQGRTSAVIAREMGIAEGTAHTHVMHVYQKLGVHSQQELLDLVHNDTSTPQE